MRALAEAIAPARIELVRRRLEDVFVDLVAKDGDRDSGHALRTHLQGLSDGRGSNMMGRIGLVAKREFVTTVGRKGFLIGVFIMPLFMVRG